MYAKKNKEYWEKCNINYSKVWEPLGRQEMSKLELNFITKYLLKYSPNRILDVGVGNGRILENLIKFSLKKSKIFGIDVSSQMVNICRNKFNLENKIKKISVCDLSQEDICFEGNFDFITMIRVLKYNKNWEKMIKKVYGKLISGGVYIFTMPNKISISGLSGDTFSDKNIPIIYSSQSEIKNILTKFGFKIVEIRAFSKMPNFFYHIFQNKIYVKFLIFIERILDVIFGKAFLGRELFIVCEK
jgi:ubiquinone/menaquinone biosynthesis C-methylase UbiE